MLSITQGIVDIGLFNVIGGGGLELLLCVL